MGAGEQFPAPFIAAKLARDGRNASPGHNPTSHALPPAHGPHIACPLVNAVDRLLLSLGEYGCVSLWITRGRRNPIHTRRIPTRPYRPPVHTISLALLSFLESFFFFTAKAENGRCGGQGCMDAWPRGTGHHGFAGCLGDSRENSRIHPEHTKGLKGVEQPHSRARGWLGGPYPRRIKCLTFRRRGGMHGVWARLRRGFARLTEEDMS